MKKLLLFSFLFTLLAGLNAQPNTKDITVYGTVFNTDKQPVPDWVVLIGNGRTTIGSVTVKTAPDGSYKASIQVPADPIQTISVMVKDPCKNILVTQSFNSDVSSSNHDFIICSQAPPPNPCRVAFKYEQTKNSQILTFHAYPELKDAEYFWDFGDGTTGTGNPARHEYKKAGDYKVLLRVKSPNCEGSYGAGVKVEMTTAPPPPPPPSTSIEARCCGAIQILSTPVTTNTGGSTFKFYAKGDFPLEGVRWDFGDGNFGSGAEVTHTYTTPGKYKVTAYLVGTDCKVELSAWVHAGRTNSNPCNFDFFHKTDGLDASFGLNIRVVPDKINWNFGDGNSSSDLNPKHTYAKSGEYKVTVEVIINGQYCKIEKTIKLSDGGSGSRCPFDFAFRNSGLTSRFSPIVSTTKYDKLEWHFGDGNSSTEEFPSHTYARAGTYQVTLVVYYGNEACKITKEIKISSLTGGGGASIIDVSPNPVDEEMTIRVKSAEKIQAVLVISDMNGLNLKKKAVELEPGENVVPWDTNDLQPGYYILQLFVGSEVVSRVRFQKS
ncbi:MAG: PKD domain-containing protein [Saprospiraceae bacterium]|nr:PKD domain-containing protein [Saprospiraceae bacterium]